MSEEDVIELSSDSIRSLQFEDDKVGVLAIQAVKEETYCQSRPISRSSSSTSLDDCFPSGSEDEACTPPSSQKLHGISSSDEDIPSQTDFDSGLGGESKNDLTDGQSTSASSSQYAASQSTEDRKAEKAAERERKQMEKHLANIQKLREKEAKKKQREDFNRKKQSERQTKKQLAFKRNQMKPNECLKYMTLVVDEKLFRTVLCSTAMQIFPHSTVNFNFKQQPLENSITWTRTQLDGSSTEEDWAAVMWPGEDVAQAIAESNLVSKFKHISQSIYPGKTIILLIFAMDLYHRKSQNSRSYQARKETQRNAEDIDNRSQNSNKYLTKEEVELGLVELQILAGVCHRHFDDSADFADVLGQFTRAIAEIPYKREQEEIDKEMGWYARSVNKNCVRANKDMQGLDKLWLQHLTVFSNTNIDTAKAITSLYPTPTILIEAYENCNSQSEKELLLQNVQVKRSGSSSAIIRRVGPELSKKICLTFTQTDGNIRLSSKR